VDIATRVKLAMAKAILHVVADEDRSAPPFGDPQAWDKNPEVLEILERHGLDEERITALLRDISRVIDVPPGQESPPERPNIGLD
jgi:hypothetical protein